MEAVIDAAKGGTLAERLLADRTEKQGAHEFTARIDCAGGHIIAHYRALDFREDRQIGIRHRSVTDIVEKEIRLAADTLAAASTGCEVHIGDEVHQMPPLGLVLTQALGMEGLETDIQAVLALFPSERAMVEQFVELENWTSNVSATVDREQLGNSEAAS